MNYNEAIKYIEGTEVFGSKPGLDSITRLTGLLNNPQDSLKFVHVAGTNGKGSVSAFISRILSEAGYRTGLYTSPHLERLEERMLIDGKEIAGENVAKACEAVKGAADVMLRQGLPHPTEFELVTALALVYFAEQRCDIAVLEVGLGGRLDATNVISVPEVAVITAIGRDHTGVLGESLSLIAGEKAGIIKHGGRVATCAQEPEVMEVIRRVCAEKDAALFPTVTEDIHITGSTLEEQTFDLCEYKNLSITLLGEHQAKNAALAVKAAEILREKGWSIPESAVRGGLSKTKWPGRFEVIRKSPAVILDGAHNPQGARALSRTLARYFDKGSVAFVTGVLADKNYYEMLAAAAPMASRFYTVAPDSPRALPAYKLADTIRAMGHEAESFESVPEALCAALEGINENEAVCCFGSLYFIGEARAVFRKGGF